MSIKPEPLEGDDILVIGAGLMRTGTCSLKMALEYLYGGRCYHMHEVIEHGQPHILKWMQFIELSERGEGPKDSAVWNELLNGYCAIVDLPGCAFFEELMQAYPKAKVILSTRNADSWLKSIRNTIYPVDESWKETLGRRMYMWLLNRSGFDEFAHRASTLALGRSRNLNDNAEYKQAFHDWHQRVITTVPPERLLIFEARDGWEPLCKFLRLPCPPPEVPYPFINTTKEKSQFLTYHRRMSKAVNWILIPTFVMGISFVFYQLLQYTGLTALPF